MHIVISIVYGIAYQALKKKMILPEYLTIDSIYMI